MSTLQFTAPNELNSLITKLQSKTVIQSPAAVNNTTYSTSFLMAELGIGSSSTVPVSFVPVLDSNVRITITGTMALAAAATGTVQVSYGTGTSPLVAGASTLIGTQITNGAVYTAVTGTAAAVVPFTLDVIATGLIQGTTYWVDLAVKASASTLTVANVTVTIQEL